MNRIVHESTTIIVTSSSITPWDGITFDVDGVVKLPLKSYTPNFVSFTQALTPGIHVLHWTYFKDSSLSKGEDAAFIRVSFSHSMSSSFLLTSILIDDRDWRNDIC